MNLKFQLQALKNLSMKNYLMKMKAICDTLASFGCPVFEEEHVLSMLAGLGPKFEPTILTNDSHHVKVASASTASESRALQHLKPQLNTKLVTFQSNCNG